MKKKVLIINNYISHYRKKLFDSLDHNSHKFLFLHLSERPSHRKGYEWSLLGKNKKFFFLKSLKVEFLGKILIFPFGLVSFILKTKPDIIISTFSRDAFLATLVLFFLKPFLKFKLVFWVGDNKQTLYKGLLRSFDSLRLLFLKTCDGLILYSSLSLDLLKEKKIDLNKTILIGGQVQHNRTEVHDLPFKSQKKMKILVVSSYDPRKQLVTLLDDLNAYANKYNSDFELNIIGTEKKKVPANLKFKCNFYGRIPHKNMKTFYKEASVLILSSSNEPWGHVANEAIFNGTPIITTKFSGCSQVFGMEEFNYQFRNIEKLDEAFKNLEKIYEKQKNIQGSLTVEKFASFFNIFVENLSNKQESIINSYNK